MIIFLGKIKLQAILYTLNSEARRLLLIVSLMQMKISIGLGGSQFYFPDRNTTPGLTPSKLCGGTHVYED